MPAGQRGSALYKNLYTPLCTVLGGGILVSSRLGPRMESPVNMNEQAHDNMSASHGRCESLRGQGCLYVLSCMQGAHKSTEYQ